MTALITVFHRWCSLVIKSGRIQTALVEPSHQTDRINSCCQHLANTQLTFFVCEFSSSQTEGTLHCSLITFERLFLRSGFTWPFSFIRCYEADREKDFSYLCHLYFFLWLSSPVVIIFFSVPTCLQYMCWWMVAVVFGSGFSPCRSPLLHIKQAALRALSSSLDRTCQLGGRVDRLASNFQTQRLSPGDFFSCSLSLSLTLPLSLSPLISHSWAFLFSTHLPRPLTSAKAKKQGVPRQCYETITASVKASSPCCLIVQLWAKLCNSKSVMLKLSLTA